MDKRALKIFNADIAKTLEKCPGLKLMSNDKTRILKGKYELKDNLGVVMEEYEIAILIPEIYPKGFPILMELSKKIPRHEDRHIDEHGTACVEIHQRIILIAKRGISISNFVKKYVHKYFCWQLRYETGDLDGLEQWSHHEEGTKEFYKETFQTDDHDVIKRILVCLISNTLPERNDPCICSSGKKFKHCHAEPIIGIKDIGIEQFKIDLQFF